MLTVCRLPFAQYRSQLIVGPALRCQPAVHVLRRQSDQHPVVAGSGNFRGRLIGDRCKGPEVLA
jgi:hypothetical protein